MESHLVAASQTTYSLPTMFQLAIPVIVDGPNLSY